MEPEIQQPPPQPQQTAKQTTTANSETNNININKQQQKFLDGWDGMGWHRCSNFFTKKRAGNEMTDTVDLFLSTIVLFLSTAGWLATHIHVALLTYYSTMVQLLFFILKTHTHTHTTLLLVVDTDTDTDTDTGTGTGTGCRSKSNRIESPSVRFSLGFV